MKALMLVDMEGASGITTDRLSWTRCHTVDWDSPESLAARRRHGLALPLGLWTDERRRQAEAFLARDRRVDG